jgi:hypothetical protein
MTSRPTEGAGNAGRSTRPQPCVQNVKAHKRSHHGHAGTPGIPRAMVLTVSFALSLVSRACCHHRRPRCRSNRHQLDASIGASGPHDFAVRKIRALVSSAACVHRIPFPTSVTIASRPSCETRWRGLVEMICPTGKAKNFSERDWTGKIRLNCFDKSGFTRRRQRLHFVALNASCISFDCANRSLPVEAM